MQNKEDQTFHPAMSLPCIVSEEPNCFAAQLGTLPSLESPHGVTLLYWPQLPSLSHKSWRAQDKEKAPWKEYPHGPQPPQ